MSEIKKIRVLVVDDSLLFRETLAKEIGKDFSIEVVGTAEDPFIARDKILELEPDVVTLDVEMPKMDGIEFLKKLMPQYPLPVIVVSATGSNVFDALNAGAVDFVSKPDFSKPGGMSSFLNELIIKIKIASTAKVGAYKKDYIPARLGNGNARSKNDKIIAIGASTGGTEAIYQLIKSFPRDMPGIVIVQHMPPIFTKMYAERLNNSCKLAVKEAENGDVVRPGSAIVAAGEYHMEVAHGNDGFFIKSRRGEKVSGHCPSVDVLFNSVAKAAGKNGIGILLTGMGSDGAKGLLDMKRQGAYTIGQDQKSCIVYGMPMVAFNIGAVTIQLPLDRIPQVVCDYLEL